MTILDFIFLSTFNFNFEFLFIQVLLVLFTVMLCNTSYYYSLLYLFLNIIFYGIMLNYLGYELCAGFLWVTEYIVVFAFLLLLFYINISGENFNKHSLHNNVFFIKIFFILYIISNIYIYSVFENIEIFFYTDLLWVNYYESIYNEVMNDFTGLYISYYYLNSVILIIVGFLLFIGSIICVTLFKYTKNDKFKNFETIFKLFNFTQIFSFSVFIRKQDLFTQSMGVSFTKFFFSKND